MMVLGSRVVAEDLERRQEIEETLTLKPVLNNIVEMWG
jgi:hypothetical protein